MSKRIKLTEKQAHLVKEIMSEVDSLEANDKKTRLTNLFDGYVKIIKRYIKENNSIYSKLTFDPSNMDMAEMRELNERAYSLHKNVYQIHNKFGDNLKALRDDEYDSFGEEIGIAFEDIYDLFEYKYNIIESYYDLYKHMADQREEYEEKLRELKGQADKYFADVDTLSIG